jgi:hypothetical protein
MVVPKRVAAEHLVDSRDILCEHAATESSRYTLSRQEQWQSELGAGSLKGSLSVSATNRLAGGDSGGTEGARGVPKREKR